MGDHVLHQVVPAGDLKVGDVLAYPLDANGIGAPAGLVVTAAGRPQNGLVRLEFDKFGLDLLCVADMPVRVRPRTGPVGDLTFSVELDDLNYRRPGFVHNVIAHPLLVLWPRVGEWIHARSRP